MADSAEAVSEDLVSSNIIRDRKKKAESFVLSAFFRTFATSIIITMKKEIAIALTIAMTMVMGCKEKEKPVDIIATTVEAPQPSGPVSMQSYHDQREVQWLGKTYQIDISREPKDSLAMVSDENGQQFVDNLVKLTVRRSDGTVAISKTFVKGSFAACLDKEFKENGILEGLVFDEVDGNELEFAASVSLPQTDEYIPLEVKIDNFGKVSIERDTELE